MWTKTTGDKMTQNYLYSHMTRRHQQQQHQPLKSSYCKYKLSYLNKDNHMQQQQTRKQKIVILTSSFVLLILCNGAINLLATIRQSLSSVNNVVLFADASSTIHRLSQARRQHQQQQQQQMPSNSTNSGSNLNAIQMSQQKAANSSRIARMMVADNPKDIDALVSC